MLFEDANTALRTVLGVTALGQFVAGAQALVNWRLVGPDGILGWRSVQSQHRVSRAEQTSAPIVVFDVVVLVGLASLKCLSAGGVLVMLLGGGSPAVPLIVLVATNLGLFARFPAFHNGADLMGNLVCVAGVLAATVGSPTATAASVVFIALQASLAYAVAGVGKIFHQSWRDGSFVRELFATGWYGSAEGAAWMRRSGRVPLLLSRTVIAFEVLFPLVLLAPLELAAAGLLIGVLFHATIASVMGLNIFLWTFPATYPAIIFTNVLVRVSWFGW